MDLDGGGAVFEGVVFGDGVEGEFPFFAHDRQGLVELVSEGTADEEAAGVDGGHDVDGVTGAIERESLDHDAKGLGIVEKGGDVAKVDAGLGPVAHGADAGFKVTGERLVIHGKRPANEAGEATACNGYCAAKRKGLWFAVGGAMFALSTMKLAPLLSLVLLFSPLVARTKLTVPALANSVTHPIKSSGNGEFYVIHLRLPPEAIADPTARFPLIVTLDGDHIFPQVVSLVTQMGWSGEVPPVIVAGLGYGTLNLKGGNHRHRDYTPFVDPEFPGSGGGPAFHRFLLEDVLPFLAVRAPVDEARRYLMGHAAGGTFVLYTLARSPEAFAGYLAGSPYLKGQVPRLEEAATAKTGPAARVYVGTGSKEMPQFLQPLPELERWLASRGASPVMVSVLEGFNHHNSITPALAQGLGFLFLKPAAPTP